MSRELTDAEQVLHNLLHEPATTESLARTADALREAAAEGELIGRTAGCGHYVEDYRPAWADGTVWCPECDELVEVSP